MVTSHSSEYSYWTIMKILSRVANSEAMTVLVIMITLSHIRCRAQSLHVHTVLLNDTQPTYQLVPFPEDTLSLHVNVTHTHPYGCHWAINNTQAAAEKYRHFIQYADKSSLVLQPFGQHFYYTTCACLVIETGGRYTVIMGGPAFPEDVSITHSEPMTSNPASYHRSRDITIPGSTIDPTDSTTIDPTCDCTNGSLNHPPPGVVAGFLFIPVGVVSILCVGTMVFIVMIYARRKHLSYSSQDTIKTTPNVVYEHRKPMLCQPNLSYENHALNI